MSHEGPRTELLVIDVAAIPKRRDRLVIVERTAGRPEGGMVLTSPEIPGRWRITEFALYHPDPSQGLDPSRIPLGVEALEGANELRPGAHLVEQLDS